MQFPSIYKQQTSSIPAYSDPVLGALLQNLSNYREGYRRSALIFALQNLDGPALEQFYSYAMYFRPMFTQDERDLLAQVALKLSAGPMDPRARFWEAYASQGGAVPAYPALPAPSSMQYAPPAPALAGYHAAPSPSVGGCSCGGSCEPCRFGYTAAPPSPWPPFTPLVPPIPSMPGMTAPYAQQMDAWGYRPGSEGGPYYPALGRPPSPYPPAYPSPSPYRRGVSVRRLRGNGDALADMADEAYGPDYGGSGSGSGYDPDYGGSGSGYGPDYGGSGSGYGPDYGGSGSGYDEAAYLRELGMTPGDKSNYGVTSEDLKAMQELDKMGASSPSSTWPQGQKPATQPKSPVPPAAAAGSHWEKALASALSQAVPNIPAWVNQANQTALQREIFSFCTTNPAHPYCQRSAVPPTLQQCQATPAFPGCPQLLAASGLPIPPGTQLPVYPWQTPTPAQCQMNPNLPNCSRGSDMGIVPVVIGLAALLAIFGGKK